MKNYKSFYEFIPIEFEGSPQRTLENTVLGLANVVCWTNAHIFYRTMRLAYFLIPIKEVAAQIAQEAIDLAKIKSAEKKAHRRRWFAKERYQEGGGPTGLLMHENQFVQTMVYQEAEKYEKYQEGIATQTHIDLIRTHAKNNTDNLLDLLSSVPISQMDWVIRYLKAIVQFSNNNSADLITAVACLVCNFQPKDAATLHAFFGGISPNYCSKRKVLLMRQLKERFPLLEVHKEEGKQTHFYGQDKVDSKWSSLVEDFFTQVVPWGTKCVGTVGHSVPFIGDKTKKLINLFRKNYIFEEDHNQMAYLHTIVCPDCFLQLISISGLDCPRERLSLPVFTKSDDKRLSSGVDSNNQKIMTKVGRDLKLKPTELDELMGSAKM